MPPPLRARWVAARTRPLLLGHRGARHAAPENTFAAFNLALEEGADGVELDVRLNASGDVIVCHDLTLERVTEGRDRRALHELTTRECDAVRLANDERLPHLVDVLDWAELMQFLMYGDIKSGRPPYVGFAGPVLDGGEVRRHPDCLGNPGDHAAVAVGIQVPWVPVAALFSLRQRGVRAEDAAGPSACSPAGGSAATVSR